MQRKGPCYKNSIELLARIKRSEDYALNDADTTAFRDSASLVHGDVILISGEDAGIRIDHAWVEASGHVLDGDFTAPAAMSFDDFMSKFQAVERCRYTLEEAEALAVRYGKIGPWDLLPIPEEGGDSLPTQSQ